MKRNLNEYMDAKRSALIDPSWEDVDCLLAALEEAEQKVEAAKTVLESYGRITTDMEDDYKTLQSKYSEAQQTIARQSAALGWYELGKPELARAALGEGAKES